MPQRYQRPYPPEFRREAVSLVKARAARSVLWASVTELVMRALANGVIAPTRAEASRAARTGAR